ncbi:hypothetical protein Pan153_24350 [Gimesia panareensis]|uniref:Pectate lyase C n=1 Tax=Gimesia panareensis TaxID=2527978 RepID=A0A518FN76_9PLAN|nr:LamG-like jellyroll fold domain-containing protein [Gimesia panareensis]QDV17780.1 hypothetical protein Pan153_24350 [Gimesia panareensis]
MLLTNWLSTLTSRVNKRPVFRSRDRRAIRRRWQTACSNQIATTEVLEDRTLLTTLFVDDSLVITNDQGAGGLDAGDTVTFASGEAGETAGLIFGTNAFDTINDAVTAAAASGDTIQVAAGTYSGLISLNKSVDLLGANAGIDPNSMARAAESIIDHGGFYAIQPTADDVTIDGFSFEGDGGRAIDSYASADNLTIANNIFNNTNIPGVQGGIQLQSGSFDDLTVEQNLFQFTGDGDALVVGGGGSFERMHIVGNHFAGTTGGIFQNGGTINDAVVEQNEFTGGTGMNMGDAGNIQIRENTFDGTFFTGFQVGTIDGEIVGNTFQNIEASPGFFGQAFELWGGQYGTTVSENVTIENNVIHYNDVAGAADPTHGIRLRLPDAGSGIDASTIHINNNAFIDGGVRGDAKAIRHFGDQTTAVDASGNWWGTINESSIAALMEDADGGTPLMVDFTPFLDNGTDTDLGTAGFQGDFSKLHVTALGSQAGATNRIQEGVDLVTPDGIVEVEDGTYTGNVDVDKTVTIQGANAGIAAGVDPGVRGPESELTGGFRLFANDVVIDGLKIVDGTGPAGIGSKSAVFMTTGTTGHTIENNILEGPGTGVESRGVLSTFNGNNDNITIQNNEIYDWVAGIHNQGNTNVDIFGNNIHNVVAGVANDFVADVSIEGNAFSNSLEGIGVNTISNGTPDVAAHDNFFDSSTITNPIAHYGGDTVDASGNWWGSTDETTIANSMKSDGVDGDASKIDFTSYLNSGADDDAFTAGFQGDFSVLNVTALGAQTGPDGRIQEAVAKVTPGGTINIKSGTYAGNVDVTATGIDKSVTLAPGNSPGQVVINGDLKLDSNDQLDIEVNGTVAGTDYDHLVVNGELALGDAHLNLIDGFDPTVAQSFVLLENDDTDGVIGTFNGLPEGYEFTDFLGVVGLSAYLTYAGGDGNDVAIYTEIPTPVVTVPADGNPDDYSLQIVGGNVIVTDVNTGDVISNTPLAALGGPLVINGEDGQDDTLSIDMTGIDETTPLQIIFNGGTGGNDAIELTGGSLTSMEYLFVNASDGSIQLNGSGTDFITYTGLEPISSTVNVTTVTLNYSGVDETITVTDAGSGQTTVDSTASESVTFDNPTGTLTINAGGGLDTIDVDSLAPGFIGNLEINGEADADIVNLNAPVSLAGGKTLTVNAEEANVANGASVTAAAIALNAATISLDADLISSSVSGDATTVNLPGSAGGADLQDAVDVAGTGGVINVAAGSYLVASTLDIDESVSIVGAGKDVVQIRKAGAPSTYDIVADITVDNVTISGAQLGWQTHTSGTDYRGYVVYTTADYTTLNNLLFSDNYRSAVVFEGADYLEVSDSVFEGKFGRAAIRDGDSGSGEHFLITRNEFSEDHYRWGPISIGPQGTFNDPNNQAFSGEISYNYFNNGVEAGAFQEEGDQNYTIIVTNQGMTADGLDIVHNTFAWEDASTVNQLGNYAQAGGVYFDPALPVAPGEVNITDNIFDGYSYQGPQPSTDPLWHPADGIFGGALEFDGVDDYGFFQDAAFDVGTAGTLNFWIKMDDTNRRNQFFEGLNDVGFEFQYRENSGGEFFGSPGRGGNVENYAIQDGGAASNAWQNLQYTWDFNAAGGPQMHIYIDGVEVGYYSATYDSDLSQWVATVSTVSQLITVGKDAGGGRYFDGLMDDVGWFNAALDQTDRDNIRNNGVSALSADGRLVAHWDFDQAAGDIAVDNKNGIQMYIVANGISPLGPVFRPGMGQFGGALEFDGLDDFATFQDPSFDVGASGTLNFWVNMDDASRRNQFFEGPGDAGLEFQYRENSGGQFFGRAQDDGEYVISSGGDSAYQGSWTNIQYTWDASTGEMRIYVNGTEQSYLGGFDQNLSNFDLAHFTDTINGLMSVGRDPGDPSRFFDGMMDDIAWFDTVLTPTQLDDIRISSVGGSALNGDASLIAYWNLDDAPGTDVAAGNGGTSIDLNIQAEPPLPPIEGFGVIAPANANVTYNAFNDNDLDSNQVLDSTNQFGDPLFAYENDVLYVPSNSLEDKFAIGFGSSAAYGSSEFAVDTATDTPHIGAFQDSTLFGSGDIVVYGTSEDDLLDITFTDANTAVFILTTDVGGPGETTLGPVILTGITSLTFNGLDGDDTFRIHNPATGYVDPVGGVTFNGGTGGENGAGDVLEILGGTATTVEHRFDNANDGSIFYDSEGTATITYTGLEPVLDTMVAPNRIFSYTGGAEIITLSDDGDVGDGESQIASTLGESVVFTHPTGTLTINTEVAGGSGADTVIVNAVDSTFTSNLTVNAGNDDTLTLNTADIGAGNADLNANQVNVNGTFTTSGTVDVDANDQITFAAAGVIDATANTIDLTAGNNIQLGQITTSGDVTVTATAGAISDANAGNNITANNATLTAGTGAGVGDALETAIAALEANIGAGLELDNTGALNIGFAGGINGVQVGAPSTITSTDTMTVTENVAATGGNLLLQNTGGNFNLNALAIISNNSTFEIGIDSAGAVTLADTSTVTSSGTGLIDIDAVNNIALANVNTSGEVQVTTSTGAITDNSGSEASLITADTAALRAATGIGVAGAGDIDLAINTMAADTTAGDIFLQEPSAATVGIVDGLIGMTAPGHIFLAIGGTLNINSAIEATGAASIVQANVQGDINVNNTVQTNGGGINLYADDNLVLGASSLVDTTTAELVRLFADFNNDSSGGLTQAEGSLVNAHGGDLVARAYGDVEIANLQSAGGRVVVISTGGGIVDNTGGEAALITAGQAALSALNGIGTPTGDEDIDTVVGTLSAFTTNNDVVISNTGALIIGDVIPLSGVTSTNGAVSITTFSPLTVASNVTAAGTVTLTATDNAGPGDDLTINGGGVTVESTGADVVLNSGDDFLLSLGGSVIADTTITVNIDPITDGAGATVDLLGNVDATLTTINGGDDSDIFNILPTSDSPITINGGDPTLPGPGDTLNLDFSGLAADPALTLGTGPGSGTFNFLAPDTEQAVSYTSIEDVNTNGSGSYHLVLDMFLSGFQNAADDTIDVGLDAGGTNLLIDINGGNFFTGDDADILSFTVLGSNDNDTLNINETAGGLPFFATAAPAGIPGSNGAHLNLAAETFLEGIFSPTTYDVNDITIHYDGKNGTDAINVNFLTDHNAGYFSDVLDGLGSGNIAAASLLGSDIDLGLSFANVEGVGLSGSGTGGLHVDASSTPATTGLNINDDGTPADGVSQITGNGGFTDLLFDGFDDLEVFSGTGAETIDLIALDSATTLTSVSLYSDDIFPVIDTGNDTIRVRSTPAGVTDVIVRSGLGDDLIQVFDAGSTVNNIFAALDVDGEGGNDTLTIVDSGDGTGDTFEVTSTTVDGLSSSAGTDVTFANIDNLNVTGTDGDDTINVNLGLQEDLNNVTINGAGGDDDFNVQNSTPAGVNTVLNGQAGNDEFFFLGSNVLRGFINGGDNVDTIDYSGYTPVVHVELTGLGSFDGFQGTENNGSILGTGPGGTGFDNINDLVGSAGVDTLEGPNLNNYWGVTSTDAGFIIAERNNLAIGRPTIAGDAIATPPEERLDFTSFQNLIGGTQDDRFDLSDGAGLTGSLDGDAGNDSLDYRDYTTGVNVDLFAGTATNIGGGLVVGTGGGDDDNSIENVFGGDGNDNITGDNDNNILGDGLGSDNLDGGGYGVGSGNGGNDVFLMEPGAGGSADVITDIHGNDTVDFRFASAGIVFDVDIINTPQDVFGGNTIELRQLQPEQPDTNPSFMENVVGSEFDDYIFIDPLSQDGNYPIDGPPVLRAADGRGGTDTLDFDAKGQAVIDTGYSLTADGVGTVQYLNFENVTPFEDNPATIVDDGDLGFSLEGDWPYHPAGTAATTTGIGYADDVHTVPSESTVHYDEARAFWEFYGLTPGVYRVSVTWPASDNAFVIPTMATDAPYTVFDGSRNDVGTTAVDLGTFDLNQQLAPDDFQADGALWEDLGTFTINSRTLTVMLTNLADGLITADAVRIERVSAGPEVQLTDVTDVAAPPVVLVDGNPGGIDFGTTELLTDLTRTFEITNTGSAPLNISNIVIPTGFTTTLTAQSVGVGATISFDITMDSNSFGDRSGLFSFDTDDVDEATFNLLLHGQVSNVVIIDNGDADFSATAGFETYTTGVNLGASGYEDDIAGAIPNQPGNTPAPAGTDTATWTFSGLADGFYRVSTTWPALYNRAADAPFSLDGGAGAFALDVDQTLVPSSFAEDGTAWFDLNTSFEVVGGVLTVTLTNIADSAPRDHFDLANGVIADAVRIEYLPTPDLEVTVDGNVVDDDTGVVDFGTTIPGIPVAKTFTITNLSADAVDVTGLIEFPPGFSIDPASPFGTDTVPVNIAGFGSVTFTVQFDGGTTGSTYGQLSFTTGDADENPYNFTVVGAAGPATVGINDTDFATSGSWTGHTPGDVGDPEFLYTGEPYVGGSGANEASWTFDVEPGRYQVVAHWYVHPDVSPYGRAAATNAPYTIFSDATPVATYRVSQQTSSDDFLDDGTWWEYIGDPVVINDSTLTVVLSDDADGIVYADDVRIIRVVDPVIKVEVDGGAVDDGGTVDFEDTIIGAPVVKTFTVTNFGERNMALGAINVPTGFSLVTGFGDTNLAPGASTTFSLQMDASVGGSFSGMVSFGADLAEENPFNFTVSGSAADSMIVDNGDLAYSTSGAAWQEQQRGYASDLEFYQQDQDVLLGGDLLGTNTATWTFDNLGAGTYQVASHWMNHSSFASNAQITIGGIEGGPITVSLDQRFYPQGFSADGTIWQELGNFQVTAGGTLTVTITDDGADGDLAADAMRLELIPPGLTAPEIDVQAGATALTSGVSNVDLGTAFFGETLSQTFTITNTGTNTLNLGAISLPGSGEYTVSSPLGTTNLAAGHSTTFEISFSSTGVAGPVGGVVSIVTNDSDENPFTFNIAAAMTDVLIIDDGDAAYNSVGNWDTQIFDSRYFESDGQTLNFGQSGTATWDFTGLAAGTYTVSATWYSYPSPASNAEFNVSGVGPVVVDQQVAPNDFTADGADWEILSAAVVVGGGGSITVTLSDNGPADGAIIADAIRIQRTGPLLAAAGVSSTSAPSITQSDLDSVVDAALSYWESAGLSDAQLELLQSVNFVLADLPDAMLGGAAGTTVLIDVNAAGYGWFVDGTPLDSSEFTLIDGSLLAGSGSAAFGQMDLLTVVMHELGHTLGLEDLATDGTLMSDSLDVSERRLPTEDDLDAFFSAISDGDNPLLD